MRAECSCKQSVRACPLHGIPPERPGFLNTNAGAYPEWLKDTRNRKPQQKGGSK